MPEDAPTDLASQRLPLRKKLAYLAIFGVALSVGTLLVVMSVFTGFHLQLTSVIRGYLSDLTIRPAAVGQFGYGLEDWRQWRRQVAGVEHVAGVAPFLDGIALLRLPGRPTFMSYVQVRGVDPDLEGDVSDLPDYMEVGSLADLKKTYPTADGGTLKACFVGSEFPGFSSATVRYGPGELILITATRELERQLAKFAVNGVFKTGNYDYDSRFVIMALDTATEFVKSGGAVTGLNVRLDDYKNADAVRDELARRFRAGRVLRSFDTDSTAVDHVALSGDGGRLAAVTSDGRAIVWEVATGRQVLALPAADVKATVACLSADGALLLVGRADGSAVLYDTESAQEVSRAPSAGSPATSVGLSPDDYYCAVGREDGSAALWEAEGPGEPLDLRGHTAAILDIAFNPDGERLATASSDGTARIWDVESGRARAALPGIAGAPMTAVAFAPDGERLLTGQANGVVALWDAAARPLQAWPVGGGSAVQAILFGPGSDKFMTATAGEVRAWEMETLENGVGVRAAQSIEESIGDLRSVTFSGNGQKFVSVGADGVPRLRYSGPQFSIKTWEEYDPAFMEAIAMEQFLQALILSLILVLAEFFIFALVSTMVSEKRRDIGILKAVGFTSRQVSTIFLVIGLSIGVLGGALGVGGGLLFAHNINAVREFIKRAIHFDPFPPSVYYFTEVPSHVTLGSVVAVGGGAILCALLFSILPAVHAARMDPVRTLHYE